MGSESLMDGTSVAGRVQALRELMKVKGVDYYLVPSADAHQSEYVPDCWQRRTWISGFTGSAGDVVVGLEGAWAWADSRYWLQADDELDSAVYTVQRQGAHGVPGVVSWLGSKAQRRVIAVDPRLVGLGLAKRLHKAVHQGGGQVAWLESNLIDEVWDQQPSLPTPPATVWPERFAGRSVSDKLQDLREALSAASCDALVVTTLDAIAWLFNIRGTDVDFNPVLISYAIVGAEETTLFVDQSKIDAATRQHLSASGVSIDSYDSFGKALDGMSGRVWVDATYASRWAADRLDAAGVALHVARSPIMLLKAVKNAVEVAGMHTAHVRDGVAIVRFLHWLESAWQGGALDEISASDQLEAFRAEGEHYRGLSFDTISGFESNGAIVHYRASEATSKRIDDSALYLVDSGGQYLDGTTDITRTVHLGEPTAEERDRYTRVLRGHLALRHARFPRGTSGSQLDAFARRPLWDIGLQYGHGTGHGVGCYLNVHQGPHGIASRYSEVGLEPGMIVSNEPGYYRAGAYGIRVENLCVVVEVPAGEHGGDEPFYTFEDLTVAPYARNLIDVAQLSAEERAQVDAYHLHVRQTLTGLLSPTVQQWLDAATEPLSTSA